MISIRHRITAKQILFTTAALVLLILVARVVTQTVHAAASESRTGRHVLTVYDNGQERGLLTEADTLREALEEAGIDLAKNDITEPSLDEELVAASYEVNIYRARPVTVVDSDKQTKVMTPYRTSKQIAKQAGIELRAEDRVDMEYRGDVLVSGSLERMVIDRATKLKLMFFGKEITVYTQAETVSEMLEERDIEVGEADKLSVKLSTPIKEGMKVELWRDGTQTVTREESVDFPVQQIEDADRPASYRKVQTPGVKGKKTVTYKIEMRNGREVSREVIKSVVTKQPVKQVEIVGKKSTFSYSGGPLNDMQLQALGECESGMNPTTNTGNSFYGAFQFTEQTWRSMGTGYDFAHQAPLEVQKQAVQKLLSQSSIYTQFPACAKKMAASGLL